MPPLDEAEPSLPASLGPYTIRQRIAVGGMSEVFLAAAPQRVGAARTVVVKRMLPRVAADPALRQMFVDEATLGMHIRHPNVVEVLDFLSSEEGQPFLALEYVHGVDLWRLGRWLTRAGVRLPVEQAVFVTREMLAGLHAVHEARDERGQRLEVVHRDVSPSNVLLSVHGDVKLGDLGIAHAAARERYREAGVDPRTKGKLGYLAPEQVRGRESDRRSDVFSAAVVAAELLMGRPLFAGGSELAVLLAIRDSKIHPFVEFSRELPEGLAAVVIGALSADPSQRPPGADQLAHKLAPFQCGPRLTLQEELARYVQGALAERPPTSPLAATPTRTVTNPEAALNAWSDLEASPLPKDLTAAPSRYMVQCVGGERLGPWPFAKVVEAISTGQLGPLDRVLIDDQPPQLLCEVPELARHIPASTATTMQGNDTLIHSGALVPLQGGGFVGALANAAVDRFTGLLLCEREGVRKEVYVKAGAPAFVTSNQASELLGEHLVSRGVISRGELDMALAVMPRFEGRLGDTLAALGLVEPVTLFRHIGAQVREKLLELFLWPDGSCTPYLGVSPPESSFPLELSPWEVIDEGIGWRMVRGLEADALARAEQQRCARVEGPRTAALHDELPPEAARVFLQLAQPTLGAALWQTDPSEAARLRTQRALLLLLHLQAVRWES